MTPGHDIRRLRPVDAVALHALRRAALERHPLVFSSTPDSPRATVSFLEGALAEDDHAVFGAFAGASLVGMVGLLRESGSKRRHVAGLWGMYVAEQARGRGVGRVLLLAAIEHARRWGDVSHVQLGVTDAAPEARALYESAGFREWGREPRALQWDGRFVDELHFVLEIVASPLPST